MAFVFQTSQFFSKQKSPKKSLEWALVDEKGMSPQFIKNMK